MLQSSAFATSPACFHLTPMARTKKQKTEPLATVTEQEKQRGHAFAAWLTSALHAAGTNPHQLSQKRGMPSSTYLYWFLDNGISNTGEYKRPSEAMVKALAHELRSDVNDGLRAAGYDTSAAPAVPIALANLPPAMLHTLASLISDISNLDESVKLHAVSNIDYVQLPILEISSAKPGTSIFNDDYKKGARCIPKDMLSTHDPGRCFIVRVQNDRLASNLIAVGDLAMCVQSESAKPGDLILGVDDGRYQIMLYTPGVVVLARVFAIHREL